MLSQMRSALDDAGPNQVWQIRSMLHCSKTQFLAPDQLCQWERAHMDMDHN